MPCDLMYVEEVTFFNFSGGGLTDFQKEKEEIMKSKITFVLALAAMVVLAAGTAWAEVINVDVNDGACNTT